MTVSRFNYRIIINGIISFVSSDGRMTISFELGSVKKEVVWPNLIVLKHLEMVKQETIKMLGLSSSDLIIELQTARYEP
jgi:hypothetical protein